ncbi:hypothetical protein GNP92_11190 [Paenibacillus timonensis]|nr:hypothetical protein [Paenibacillus timonensis]MUG86905.1 hypothetical protein [Paenibacillus timonensis]
MFETFYILSGAPFSLDMIYESIILERRSTDWPSPFFQLFAANEESRAVRIPGYRQWKYYSRNEEMLMQLGNFIKHEMYGIMELSKLVHEQRDIKGVLLEGQC